jgi:hypothetical protein
MNELTSYLDAVENRVKTLESQNESLTYTITELRGEAKQVLPKTGLLSKRFFARAFTVWGHYFVAQFLIALVAFVIILAIVLILTGIGAISIDPSKWLSML